MPHLTDSVYLTQQQQQCTSVHIKHIHNNAVPPVPPLRDHSRARAQSTAVNHTADRLLGAAQRTAAAAVVLIDQDVGSQLLLEALPCSTNNTTFVRSSSARMQTRAAGSVSFTHLVLVLLCPYS